MYELLDPETKCSGLILRGFVLHYLLLSVDVVLCLSLELCSLDIALQQYNTGADEVDCGSWIRWLVSRVKSCADKLGGGRGKDTVQ